jgi:hypothetical protein
MAIYKNETVLYVRLFNNMYYFFVSESDRNANVNFIYQSIKLPTGVNVTFDFNHISHTNNRLVFAVEDTKHEQINANYVPGVSDYSKLIFDQGAFGQISGVQPFMVVGSNPYTGVLKVFSANVLGANISSSIPIEVESAMKSIGGPSNSLNLEIGDSTATASSSPSVKPLITIDAAFNNKTNQYDIYVGVVNVGGNNKFVLYTLNADYHASSYFEKSGAPKIDGFIFKEIDVSSSNKFINFNKKIYNFIFSSAIYGDDGGGAGPTISHPLEIQKTDSSSSSLFELSSTTKTVRGGSSLPAETSFTTGREDTNLTGKHLYYATWDTTSIDDGIKLKIVCRTHGSMGSLYDDKLWFNKKPDLELFVNKEVGDIKIYQPVDGGLNIITHFDTTTEPSSWTIDGGTSLKAGTQIGTLVDNTSHARMFVEGSHVRFYYKGFDNLDTSKLILSRNKNGSSPIFTQESKISETLVVPVNNNAFAPYDGLREQALYVYDENTDAGNTTPITYYNESGPSNVEIYGHGLVNGVVFHTISPGLPLCFHENTPIMTEHGKVPIKDLKRGTMVQTLNGLKPLARLMINEYIIFGQEFVKFPAHCLGENVPTTDVLCTREHPLMFKFKTIAAKEFVGKVKGVEIVHSTSNQYNLLFEEQEYINIEGITFVSHHPNHSNNSLKIEEYFNPMKFRPGVFKEKLFKFEELQLVV